MACWYLAWRQNPFALRTYDPPCWKNYFLLNNYVICLCENLQKNWTFEMFLVWEHGVICWGFTPMGEMQINYFYRPLVRWCHAHKTANSLPNIYRRKTLMACRETITYVDFCCCCCCWRGNKDYVFFQLRSIRKGQKHVLINPKTLFFQKSLLCIYGLSTEGLLILRVSSRNIGDLLCW